MMQLKRIDSRGSLRPGDNLPSDSRSRSRSPSPSRSSSPGHRSSYSVDSAQGRSIPDPTQPWEDFRSSFTHPVANESVWYQPHTRLLYTLFSVDGPYNVVRKFPDLKRVSPEGKYVGTALVVEVRHRAVFLLDIEAFHESGSYSRTRGEQMKSKFKHLGQDTYLPVLYGASAYGPRLHFYRYNPKTDVMNMEPNENNCGELLNDSGMGLKYLKGIIENIKDLVDKKLGGSGGIVVSHSL